MVNMVQTFRDATNMPKFKRLHFQLPMGVGHPIFKRNRHTFICQPTGEISPEKESNIQAFSEKYAADQDLVVKYIHHLAYLNTMKQKRERQSREKAERESNLTYEDVEWGKLLCHQGFAEKANFLYLICISNITIRQPKRNERKKQKTRLT